MKLLVVILCAVLLPQTASPPPLIREVSPEIKLRLVEQINRNRVAAGLRPVEYSPELARAADEHCREMLREGYTSHWNRAGWKPYLRYAQAGIRLATSENIFSAWDTNFPSTESAVWERIREGHASLLAETPPNDGHRRSILDPHHTHVGVGVAFGSRGMRVIEVFGARYAELEPLPAATTLKSRLDVRGRLLSGKPGFMTISVYYEPLPEAMSVEQLHGTFSYGYPAEEKIERLMLREGEYVDGSQGTVSMDAGGGFRAPLVFWKKQAGVYTVGVWVRPAGKDAFVGAMASIIVER